MEKDIELKFVKWCKKNNIDVSKYFDQGLNGAPDRLVRLHDGVHVYIEFKQPGKKPRASQMKYIKRLFNLGNVACWVDSAEDAIYLVDSVKKDDKVDIMDELILKRYKYEKPKI